MRQSGSKQKTSTQVGIDVSGKTLDVCFKSDGKLFTVPNTDEGFNQILKSFADYEVSLILMESTGRYEDAAACFLQSYGFDVVVVNPRHARDFAKGMGKLAKTDRIDAAVLADMAFMIDSGAERDRKIKPLTDKERKHLSAMSSRRHQVVNLITIEKQRLSNTSDWAKISIEKIIKFLNAELKGIDKTILKYIKKNFADLSKMLLGIKGIGEQAMTVLIAEVPELGKLDRRRISALIGVAPFNCDSGNYCGRRRIWGGRKSVRNILYMGVISATRFNPVIKVFYERLINRGKSKRLVFIACMRKLLTIINAMVRDNKPFNPDLHKAVQI